MIVDFGAPGTAMLMQSLKLAKYDDLVDSNKFEFRSWPFFRYGREFSGQGRGG